MGISDRVVVLIDMDCFYCQVEEKFNPTLKNTPVAVVQYNAWRGGGIIAVNYRARAEGVTRHMRGNEAKKKCPHINLVQVPEVRGKADLTKYREAGAEVASVLATFTPLLQRASVDEAYLDITEQVEKRIAENLNDLTIENLPNTFVVDTELVDYVNNIKINPELFLVDLKLAVGALITEEVRLAVFKKTGYECSAGIAHNKTLAKLVCSMHKPNKQTILPQDKVEQFFEKIPIHKIKNLGGKFGQNVANDFNITFVGQLAQIPEKKLLQKYEEKAANWLYKIARGIDLEPVTAKLVAKSIACCKNFSGNTALKTSEKVMHWLDKLAAEMSERLEKDLKDNNRKAKQLVVSFIHDVDKKAISSSRTRVLNSYDQKRITRDAFEIINKFCLKNDNSYCIKYMGLSANNFEDIKNVREITSFFQVGPCSTSTAITKNLENEDVYNKLTQELVENPEEFTYFDDSNLVDTEKNLDSSIQLKAESTMKFPDPTQRLSPSFFSTYFVSDDDSPHFKATPETHLETLGDPSDIETETTKICPKCNESIPLEDFNSHLDFHLAVTLSENETQGMRKEETLNKIVKISNPKESKRKDFQNPLSFFLKRKVDSTVITDTCPECKLPVNVEEMSSHQDYHYAKKLHMEINAVKSTNKVTNSSKPKLKAKKSQTSNKSVISYFKST